jgi:hypothetical protein
LEISMSLLTVALSLELNMDAMQGQILHHKQNGARFVVREVDDDLGDEPGVLLTIELLGSHQDYPENFTTELWLRPGAKNSYEVEGHIEDLKSALRSVTATLTVRRATGGIVSFYEVHDSLPVTITLGRQAALARLHEWEAITAEAAQAQLRSTSPYPYHRVRTTFVGDRLLALWGAWA